MTKQEVIKQAWINTGMDFEKIEPLLKIDESIGYDMRENGWIQFTPQFKNINGYNNLLLDFIALHSCRPKSLSGIENNQGWIKLEGKPNEIEYDGDVWIINKNGGIEINLNHEYLELGYATHYQPIIKPKPPIY